MALIEQVKNNPVIERTARQVWLTETIRRLRIENRELQERYDAMHEEYFSLLKAKYKYSQLLRAIGKDLHKERKLHRKSEAWLLKKLKDARALISSLRIKKAKRKAKQIAQEARKSNEVA